jgi:XapX domain-containing protein
MIRIAIGFVLSFVIGAGCRYFDIPAASPPVIPGAHIVLAMTLGYSSMNRIVSRKDQRLEKAHERKSLGFHTLKRSRATLGAVST